MRIGVPRAFYYHRYSSLIHVFFSCLGDEIVLSRTTDHALLSIASAMEPELCLPARLYLAHIHDLRGKVDYILAPLIYSIARDTYTCPRILAAPKLAELLWKDLPPLINPSLWFQEGDHDALLRSYAAMVARTFGRDPDRACLAMEEAVAVHEKHVKDRWKKWLRQKGEKSKNPVIAFLAHPYVLGDPVLSRGIRGILEREGIGVIGQDSLPLPMLREYYEREKMPRPITWNSGRELLGALGWSLQEEKVKGMIILSYFSCGMDSFMEEIRECQFGRLIQKPLLSLVVDEEMAPNTLWNRLDAFLDMIRQ
jgi:predicted nucleotide-binding protein (sugar kinase/HSP70/actin superfamily)